MARMAWAVMSGELRSKGNLPQPLQKVGMPPSLFCSHISHSKPFTTSAGTSSLFPLTSSFSHLPSSLNK